MRMFKSALIFLISIISFNAQAEFYGYDASDLYIPYGESVETDLGFKYAAHNYAIKAMLRIGRSFALGDIMVIYGKDGKEGLRFWVHSPGLWKKVEWEDENVQEEAQSIVTLRVLGQNVDGSPILAGGGAVDGDIQTCLVPLPDDCFEEHEPLIIDMGQDGIHLGAAGIGIEYDFFGEGFMSSVQWVEQNGNDAFLALDHNGNGEIDNGSELFGRGLLLGSTQRASHGFVELRQYDLPFNGGNFDGVIDAQDGVWGELLLWTDLNADGLSTPDELMLLSDSDITQLPVDAKENARRDAGGNALRFWAWATGENTQGNNKYKMVDVFFAPLNTSRGN